MKKKKPALKTTSFAVEDYARMTFPEFLRNTTYVDWHRRSEYSFGALLDGIRLVAKSLYGIACIACLLVISPIMKPIESYIVWRYLRKKHDKGEKT